jgi:uncharacterized membrane protein
VKPVSVITFLANYINPLDDLLMKFQESRKLNSAADLYFLLSYTNVLDNFQLRLIHLQNKGLKEKLNLQTMLIYFWTAMDSNYSNFKDFAQGGYQFFVHIHP